MNKLTLAVLTVALAGCYSDRWVSNFDQFPDINETTTAIVDESGMSEADQERRVAELRRIAAEPEPAYRINAGDKLNVTVYDHPDLSMLALVTPDGYLGMVFLRQIKVAGMTLPEATEAIEKALSEFILKPAVGLTPVEIASQTVSVVGAVGNPGVHLIHNGMRISDVYAMSGGSSVRNIDGQWLDIADLNNSVFIREGKILPVDFRNAIEHGDLVDNLTLKKGDYIHIAARTESMVCLIGDVIRPHKRIWDPNLGLLEILTTGGWMKETYYPRVILIRGGFANPTMFKIDVDAILTGRAPNVMMKPSDVIYVPKDDISEYNVFVRKLLPTTQIVGTFLWPTSLLMNR